MSPGSPEGPAFARSSPWYVCGVTSFSRDTRALTVRSVRNVRERQLYEQNRARHFPDESAIGSPE